jgi:hypothetical protein
MSFPLLIAGLQLTTSTADQLPWRIGANQRDDQGALGFGDASLASRSRAIAKPIESLLIEAMDALADRLWVAPQLRSDACVVRSSPSQLRAISSGLCLSSRRERGDFEPVCGPFVLLRDLRAHGRVAASARSSPSLVGGPATRLCIPPLRNGALAVVCWFKRKGSITPQEKQVRGRIWAYSRIEQSLFRAILESA